MGSPKTCFLYKRVMFHFHDCGRKGSQSWTWRKTNGLTVICRRKKLDTTLALSKSSNGTLRFPGWPYWKGKVVIPKLVDGSGPNFCDKGSKNWFPYVRGHWGAKLCIQNRWNNHHCKTTLSWPQEPRKNPITGIWSRSLSIFPARNSSFTRKFWVPTIRFPDPFCQTFSSFCPIGVLLGVSLNGPESYKLWTGSVRFQGRKRMPRMQDIAPVWLRNNQKLTQKPEIKKSHIMTCERKGTRHFV